MTKGVCRVCGCTDEHACIVEGGPDEDIITTCSWIFPDLCSACCIEVSASPNEKNVKNWLVEKTCRFCANLVAGLPYKGKATWTCGQGRFDGPSISLPSHRWYSWSGIWRANRAVKAAQNKCPSFTVFERFYDVCDCVRPRGG